MDKNAVENKYFNWLADIVKVGNKVSYRKLQWFWNMTKSLGLNYMNDYFFDRDKFHEIMDKFSKRDYKPDGEGGLFTIRGCCKDLRKHDIWTQLCWYLDSIS